MSPKQTLQTTQEQTAQTIHPIGDRRRAAAADRRGRGSQHELDILPLNTIYFF